MKWMTALVLAGVMYVTPVLMFDQLVMPQLADLKHVYASAEALSQ